MSTNEKKLRRIQHVVCVGGEYKKYIHLDGRKPLLLNALAWVKSNVHTHAYKHKLTIRRIAPRKKTFRLGLNIYFRYEEDYKRFIFSWLRHEQ